MTESSQSDVVSSGRFTELMRPTVDVVRRLTDALGRVAQRHGSQPWTPSPAMDEIAAAASIFAAKSAWDGPIRDTHSFGGITLIAAADYLRTFGEVLAASPAPVFGHLIVSRSVLESTVVSSWLNEPDVGPVERVKRGLCEQLYSASELVRLGLEEDAQERLARWKEIPAAFGWGLRWHRGKPVVDTTERPSMPVGIDKLLLGDGDWKLGRSQWSYLSAVSHVTWWGLRQSVVEPPTESALGVPIAGVGTQSQSVFAQSVCVVRALRKAVDARLALMGWKDAEWESAKADAQAYELALIRSFDVSSMES